MANEEHLSILKQGVVVWNKWRSVSPKVVPDLSHLNLSGIAVSYANLRGANLSGAKLNHADLTGADLGGADLHSAHLSGANFNQVRTSSTVFTNIDFHEVRNLEKVRHYGPSEISISTLHRSEGQIPAAFLRGCGLSDWEIEAAKLYRSDLSMSQLVGITYKLVELRSDPTIQFYSCFISYSHTDKEFARGLYDSLQNRGIRCWLDEHQLLPGDDIYEQVDRGIRLWDKVLLCCSKDSLSSWWVDDEVDKAFTKEQKLMKQRRRKVLALIPLNLDGYLFSKKWKSGKATQIRARLAADFTGWQTDGKKFEDQFKKLVAALRADAGGREQPPKAKL